MNLNYFLEVLENHFPTKYALPDDRIGLQVHTGKLEIENLLVVYEVTYDILKECVLNNIDTIISFHPLIFHPLMQISQEDRVGKIITALLKNNISVISLHTRFDVFKYGTSFLFGQEIGLDFDHFLVPNIQDENFGMGIVGNFKESIDLTTLLNKIYSITKNPIRYSKTNRKTIKNIGIVGGSGMNFMKYAIENELDAFITADTTYHQYHQYQDKIVLIDPGHYETEQFIVPALAKFLKQTFEQETINIIPSQQITNPINYYPNLTENENKIEINNNKIEMV